MPKVALPVITSCAGCGACCTEQTALPIHLAGGPGDFKLPGVRPLPEALRQELLRTIEDFEKGGWPAEGTPCIWYDQDKRQCKHYEYRPTLCRDEVKVGDDACRRWRKQLGIDPQYRWQIRNGKLVKA